VYFECFKAGSFGADISRVIEDEFGDTGSIGFVFLWSDCADNSGVSYGTAHWYLQFWDEEECVGAFDVVTKSLCLSA